MGTFSETSVKTRKLQLQKMQHSRMKRVFAQSPAEEETPRNHTPHPNPNICLQEIFFDS
jgi:hypothetical protein